MKFKSILHTLIFCLLSITITAQNVSILPTGITPAPAASYPRISYDQILALPAPQAGDMAYDLTFNCLRVFNGTKWLQLITTQDIGQVSGFAWQLTSNASLSVNGMVKDASGNIYVTGNFNGTAVFGNTNYISTGDNDVFLAKYTSAGVFQWVRVAGSRAGDIALDVCLDPSGNVLITGYYFDAITFGNTILPYSGACDVFVTKYDPSGNVLWAKFAGGTGLDVSNTIETDAAGNVYFGGYFLGSITFFGNTNITINSLGGEDGFFAKLDASGTLIWAKGVQGAEAQRVKDLMMSGTDLIALGTFSNSTNFGNDIVLNAGTENTNIYLAKYNTSGQILAAIGFGGAATDMAGKLTQDANANIWACGSIYFDATIGNFNLTSNGYYDAFFVKLNSNLNILFADNFGGGSNDTANDIGVDASGNIYITGDYYLSTSNGLKTVNSNGGSDIFVAKYSNAGAPGFLQSYGGAEYDSGRIISVGSNIYIGGVFSQTVNFGNILSSNNSLNGYVLRLAE